MSEDAEAIGAARNEHLTSHNLKKNTPQLSVSLLGIFRQEWHVPFLSDEDVWKSRTAARALFKLLLCAPNRQATRSQLIGVLWPDVDEHKARESLRSAIKVLRQVLHIADGTGLLETADEDVLKLKGQEEIWVDADAFELLVQQAKSASDPSSALALWTQAKILLQGEFLAGEQASEWFMSRLVKLRRQELRAARRLMIRSLADLYVQMGQDAKAEEVLHAHVIRFPTDQDALYRLMKLLMKAECFDEARMYYEQCRVALVALGKQPAKSLQMLEEHLLTQDMLEYWRNVQIWREPVSTNVIDIFQPFSAALVSSSNQQPAVSFFPQEVTQEMLSSSSLFSLGTKLLTLAQQQEHGLFQDFIQRVETALENSRELTQTKFSRRQALELLVSVPTILLGGMNAENTFAEEDVITFCATSLPACWHLFWTGGFSEVERSLPIYFSHLFPLTQRASKFQKSAANLLSQVHQLASLLTLEREDFGSSLTHCKQASAYGLLAGDPNLQAAALIRQANTLFYRKRYPQILQTYQEAMQSIEEVSPLLKGRIYSGLASAEALLGQKQNALRHAGLAHETFPEYPEDDPGFFYTNTTRYILHFNDACMHVDFHQPKEAWESLKQAEAFVPDEVSPRGMELQNHRIIISIALGSVEQSCTHFEKVVSSGKTLASDLHQSEAMSIYDQMQATWPHEKRIRDLRDLFS